MLICIFITSLNGKDVPNHRRGGLSPELGEPKHFRAGSKDIIWALSYSVMTKWHVQKAYSAAARYSIQTFFAKLRTFLNWIFTVYIYHFSTQYFKITHPNLQKVISGRCQVGMIFTCFFFRLFSCTRICLAFLKLNRTKSSPQQSFKLPWAILKSLLQAVTL